MFDLRRRTRWTPIARVRQGQSLEAMRSPSRVIFVACVILLSLPCSIDGKQRGGPPGTTRVRAAAAAGAPELPSTLLHLHRLYMQQPPHDRTLYDVLHVSPNATVAQITKSFRRLAAQYHPDTQSSHPTSSKNCYNNNTKTSHSNNDDHDQHIVDDAFAKIRQAYEILKNDETRLPYHRYGLVDSQQAILVLTGRCSNGHSYPRHTYHPNDNHHHKHHHNGHDEAFQKLRQLMGYASLATDVRATSAMDSGRQDLHNNNYDRVAADERLLCLATDLVERLRPVVEGRISLATFYESVASLADSIKGQPLGAHILRCIGRAYKHAGQRYLRQSQRKHQHHHHKQKNINKHNNIVHRQQQAVTEHIRDSWRQGKLWVTAASWWGRAIWTEASHRNSRPHRHPRCHPHHRSTGGRNHKSSHNHHGSLSDFITKNHGWTESLGEFIPQTEQEEQHNLEHEMDDEIETYADDFAPTATEGDILQQGGYQARRALLESTQVEALWKISKIDLYRTIRHACDLVLSGEYFFFLSSSSGQREHGWVGATGHAIDNALGLDRAANALVAMGEIFVERSKDGTAWME